MIQQNFRIKYDLNLLNAKKIRSHNKLKTPTALITSKERLGQVEIK